MIRPLPHCDGSRTCTPVKCVIFFTFEDKQCQAFVVFTDNAEEILEPRHQSNSDWKFTGEDSSMIVKQIMALLMKKGYYPKDATGERSRSPTYIRFDLEPLVET